MIDTLTTSMGGVCLRKRDSQVDEEGIRIGVSGRYKKSSSSKWLLGTPFCRGAASVVKDDSFPSSKDIKGYSTFSMLPRDISQQIFDKLVCTQILNEVSLAAFRDCALQDIRLGDYPGVNDDWMDVISSQGSSLLSADLSSSDVTDSGVELLRSCPNLQVLTLNYCDEISECGLNHLHDGSLLGECNKPFGILSG
ncbi:hypothetical protein Droror1_Dr00015915 [Drosera rotundifolia]